MNRCGKKATKNIVGIECIGITKYQRSWQKGLMGVMHLSSSDCAAIFQNCLKNLYWGFDDDSFIILDWRVGKSRYSRAWTEVTAGISQCCQAQSHNQIMTSGLVPVLTAELVTTASATKLPPYKHPLAQALFFCPSFFFYHPLPILLPILSPSSSGSVLLHVSQPNPIMLASPLPGPG